MKSQSRNRKITIKFMDLAVSLEGNRGVENKAYAIMDLLINARMQVYEKESKDRMFN